MYEWQHKDRELGLVADLYHCPACVKLDEKIDEAKAYTTRSFHRGLHVGLFGENESG